MKQDRRTAVSKAFLLDTLLELMEEKDYHAISISELSERASMARQTFYRNYRNKEDILLFRMDEIFDEYLEIVKMTLGGEGGDINAMMTKLFYIWQRNEPVFLALRKAGLAFKTLERFSDYATQIQRQIDNETPESRSMRTYLSFFIAGGSFMVLNAWIEDHMHTPAEELGGLFERIMQFLITTVKDYKRIPGG